MAGEVFGTAPRELARAVSLQQTVEMVRIIIDVVEAQVDELAAPGGEAELREAVLRYTREIAFGAAQVYARTAEARGAWDARLEALVVDSLVRGEVDEGLQSWASALNWSSAPVAVIAGIADGSEPEGLIDELRASPGGPGSTCWPGCTGTGWSWCSAAGTSRSAAAAARGPVRAGAGGGRPGRGRPAVGRAVRGRGAGRAAGRAAWPDAPRPVVAADLLPERALDGDDEARAELLDDVYEPLLQRRLRAARHRHDLPGAGQLAGGHGPDAVRAPQHRPLPAAPGERADRPGPGHGRGGFTLWSRWSSAASGRLSHKRT